MSDPALDAVAAMWQRKAEWHRAQANRPLKEKVALRPLRPWERPWPIEP